MTETVFHLVRHHEVEAFERVGWTRHEALDDTHHGQWSSLMEWKGDGEPVKPFFIDPVDAQNATTIRDMNERQQWGDTYPRGRRFAEPRELGKVPVDPDAEQLAAEVIECIAGMDAA